MQFITRLGEVVMLENGKSYQVFEQKEYNSKAYVTLREVPEAEEDLLNFEKYKFKFAEEVIQNNDFYLVPVDDKELVAKLSKLK